MNASQAEEPRALPVWQSFASVSIGAVAWVFFGMGLVLYFMGGEATPFEGNEHEQAGYKVGYALAQLCCAAFVPFAVAALGAAMGALGVFNRSVWRKTAILGLVLNVGCILAALAISLWVIAQVAMSP